MGACGNENEDELKQVTEAVKEKSPEIVNQSVLKQKALDSTKEKLLKERNEALEKAIANNKTNENIKKLLKEYNLKELDIEKEYFMNEVDKIHNFYEFGLELSEPAKKATVKQIKKATPKGFCLSMTLSRIEKYSAKEFLNSKFGKPLKAALEKEGMRKSILIDKKNELLNDRDKRRKEEKTKYNLEQNEFPPDDDLVIDSDKIYEGIFEDYLKIKKEFGVIQLGKEIIGNVEKINNILFKQKELC